MKNEKWKIFPFTINFNGKNFHFSFSILGKSFMIDTHSTVSTIWRIRNTFETYSS